jgi:hypothetical protein
MIRLLFRFLALLFFAGAVVAAVVDTSRSIAASALTMKSFGAIWGDFAPQSLGAVQSWGAANLGAAAWTAISNFMLAMPAVAVLMVFAVLFYAIGFKRSNRYGRFGAN